MRLYVCHNNALNLVTRRVAESCTSADKIVISGRKDSPQTGIAIIYASSVLYSLRYRCALQEGNIDPHYRYTTATTTIPISSLICNTNCNASLALDYRLSIKSYTKKMKITSYSIEIFYINYSLKNWKLHRVRDAQSETSDTFVAMEDNRGNLEICMNPRAYITEKR